MMNCVFGIEEASYDAEEDSSEEENVNSDSEDSELLQDCLQK